MNEDLVLAITMLIILAVVVLFIQISQQIKVKRIQKMKIQRRFGEIPDMEEILPIERISVYHKHQGREDVDQVTWSDLSMDQVFQRIDQCDSAAGEAVLYNMLHCTDNGQAQWKELLKYYEEQAEPRKKAEAILISLGKEKGCIIFRNTWIHFRQVTWALCSFIACFRSSFWEVLWADCGMFRSCRWQA